LHPIPKSRFIITDIDTLLDKKINLDYIVSPANSFATMGGGIDYALRTIFPGVEKTVQAQIKERKLAVTSKGEPYLPVGKCIVVPTNDERCPYMISAPTMFTPRNIEGTNNVFDAFTAVLNELGHTDKIIACCGLGTGVGGLSGLDCALQIKKAYDAYNACTC